MAVGHVADEPGVDPGAVDQDVDRHDGQEEGRRDGGGEPLADGEETAEQAGRVGRGGRRPALEALVEVGVLLQDAPVVLDAGGELVGEGAGLVDQRRGEEHAGGRDDGQGGADHERDREGPADAVALEPADRGVERGGEHHRQEKLEAELPEPERQPEPGQEQQDADDRPAGQLELRRDRPSGPVVSVVGVGRRHDASLWPRRRRVPSWATHEASGRRGGGRMAVQAETFRHRPPAAGAVELAGSAWRVARPRATVVVAHGVNEHLGRHAGVVEALTGAGFSVVGHDHRGHGRSEGRRGHVDDFDDYARDLVALVARERGLAPNDEVVALGHSMGGLIAARAALSAQDQLAALVLSAPALAIGGGMPGWQRQVFLLMGRFLGHLPTPAGKPGGLSRDPAVEEAFGRDPLNNLERTRLRLARQIYLGGEDARARAGELRLPLLVMHGTADPITDPAGSKAFVARAASADKELRLWPDSRHEIFNDLDKAEALAYLVGWLEARFPRAGEEGRWTTRGPSSG